MTSSIPIAQQQVRLSVAEDIVRGIDHLIVMVRDLDRSEQLWRQLGFELTPRGFHDSGGTANHLVMLEGTYIELLGLVDPGADSPYRRTMQECPGLAGIALRGSAAAAYEHWLAQGLAPSVPESLARPVEIGGGRELARFELTRLHNIDALPFLLFCCEQLTPHLVWQADAPLHPNGALSLRELVIVVDDERTRAALERVSGRAATGSAEDSTLALGKVQVTLLTAAAFLRRFGAEAAFRTGTPPVLAAAVLASSNTGAAQQFAQQAGLEARATDRGGFTVNVPAEGVVIEWTPA